MSQSFPRRGVHDYLASTPNYHLLSLRDLIEARDQYHAHLMHKENVVATAVGRYRFRRGDAWPSEQMPEGPSKKSKGPRRLNNSEVRSYSWPCVLVFVTHWVPPEDLGSGGKYGAEEMVPSALYLSDGRVVPVCVVEAPRYLPTVGDADHQKFPRNNVGGGYPLIAKVQGRDHIASIACLVSDGHTTYALTNRHVCGDPGETLYARLDDTEVAIGESSDKQIARVPFQDIFREWPGKDVFVNVDVGLVKLYDLDRWTSSVRGVGVVGPMADLSVYNISLRLIGAPLRAFGAASGAMVGEIHGLFYRYKSVGGFEYVADFLIGERTSERTAPRGKGKRGTAAPEARPFGTHPGDSGTLWLLEREAAHGDEVIPPMPLAVQWGGHVFSDEQGQPHQTFALATALSTICNRLEVDLVRDFNLDQVDYWGAVGHYSIAARAIGLVSTGSPKLKKLLENNLGNISYPDATLQKSEFKGQTELAFVPLADVPDNVWKHGRQGFKRAHEGPNHFADMDQKSAKFANKDLLTLCTEDAAFIDPKRWNDFYESVLDPGTEKKITPGHRGLLPFRVRQIFEAMVDFAGKGDAAGFVCAAGVLAHYVGDACQPLHISYLHDGDPADTVTKTVGGKETQVPRAAGVHAAYEDEMVDAKRKEILDGLAKAKKVTKTALIKKGGQASQLVVTLMRDTFAALPPSEIVAAYPKGKNGFPSRAEAFWAAFGARTIGVMQDGVHDLAVLWESAWVQGGGEAKVTSTAKLTTKAVNQRVHDPSFVPSCYIDEIAALLKKG